MIQQRKMIIAAVQEAHIPYAQNSKLGGYRTIKSKAIQQEPGKQGESTVGVSILIHGEMENT